MKTFSVCVREVWIQIVEVEANTSEEAKQLVEDGVGDTFNMEYSHTLSKDLWTVEEIKASSSSG